MRYKGVFASNSSLRRLIVPRSPRSACRHSQPPADPPPQDSSPGPVPPPAPGSAILAADGDAYQPQPAPTPRPRTLDWQSLLARVYGPSALRCERCQGRLEVIAFIEDRKVVRKILEHLGLATTGPPQAPARPRTQRELFC